MVKSKKDSKLVLSILFLAWTIGYFDKTAINVASITISKEFGLNTSQIGFTMSSFFISYAFMNLLGGYLADRFGSKKVVTTIMVLWSVFTCITGISWSFVSMLIIRFIFGACEGGFPSASSVTIAELFPKEERARAKSFLISASAVGYGAGTFLVSKFIALSSWRSVFWIFGICGIIISDVFCIVFRKMKVEGRDIKQGKEKKVSLKEVIKISIVWKLAIMQFSIGVFMWGLNSWMPSYWVNVRKLDMVTMGKLSSIPWIAAFLCMNLSGWILDKLMEGHERVFLCISFAITGIATYLMYTANTVSLAILYLTITTTAITVSSPAIFAIPLKYMKSEAIGTATGVLNFGQQLAGILAPSFMGYMIGVFNGSYNVIFIFVILTVLISFLIALTVNTRKLKNM